MSILKNWIFKPDTEPKFAVSAGSSDTVSRYVLTLPIKSLLPEVFQPNCYIPLSTPFCRSDALDFLKELTAADTWTGRHGFSRQTEIEIGWHAAKQITLFGGERLDRRARRGKRFCGCRRRQPASCSFQRLPPPSNANRTRCSRTLHERLAFEHLFVFSSFLKNLQGRE